MTPRNQLPRPSGFHFDVDQDAGAVYPRPMQEHLNDPPKPLERATALSVAPYTDPSFLEIEARTVFALKAGSSSANTDELSAAGDHIIGEIAGRPIVVVRDEDNALRAFYNICRHRAGPLATCNGRDAKTSAASTTAGPTPSTDGCAPRPRWPKPRISIRPGSA